MTIQINGTTDVISASDGLLTIDKLESIKDKNGSTGSSNQILTAGNGSELLWGGSSLFRGNIVSPPSGSTVEFNDIPSYVNRITLMISNVATTTIARLLVQLGTSTGWITDSYAGTLDSFVSSVSVSTYSSINQTNAFPLEVGTNTAFRIFRVELLHLGSNNWIAISDGGGLNGSLSLSRGYRNIPSTLTRIRLLNSSGTTFNGGAVNILYE